MRVALLKESDRLEHSLSMLATVGSTSPYVGLFGTVWGIMNAFHGLGNVQQATLAMVAPGISEALIATAMGLFAAIPAVMAYNRYADQVEPHRAALRHVRRGVLDDPAAPCDGAARGPAPAVGGARMMQSPNRRGRKLMAEINVVPYIDVMLVLLIIFMVTAPLLTQGIKVDLPKAGAEPLPAELMRDTAADPERRRARQSLSEPRQGRGVADRRGRGARARLAPSCAASRRRRCW